jgi:hypothetical protein
LTQTGNLVSGHFKGRHQSGSLSGFVSSRRLFFRTNTRWPLNFRGEVNGDNIQGIFHIRGRAGEWTALRGGPGG